MEKSTVIARMTLTVRFTEPALEWLHHFPDAWFARDQGSEFLGQFGDRWAQQFVEEAEPEFQSYFEELGVAEQFLPSIRLGERYSGSLIVEAALVIWASAGTVYTVLKGVSELPAIADGISELKSRIVKRFRPKLRNAVREDLSRTTESADNTVAAQRPVPPPPQVVADADLVIDARPVRNLTPAVLKGHSVHLSCAVSREAVSIENLGDGPLMNLRLGLFPSKTQLDQWNFGDAFSCTVPSLGGHQTLVKPLSDFTNTSGRKVDVSDGEPTHLDCWVEDNYGIYLFRFFLEKE